MGRKLGVLGGIDGRILEDRWEDVRHILRHIKKQKKTQLGGVSGWESRINKGFGGDSSAFARQGSRVQISSSPPYLMRVCEVFV